jgi:hypothetical protein
MMEPRLGIEPRTCGSSALGYKAAALPLSYRGILRPPPGFVPEINSLVSLVWGLALVGGPCCCPD